MMTKPTVDEIRSLIRKGNTGKALGLDGITVELLRFGGKKLAEAIHIFILGVDAIDAILLSLYKVKGSKSWY